MTTEQSGGATPSRRDLWTRLLLLVVIIGALLVFSQSGLRDLLRWEVVRERVETWQLLAQEHLVLSLAFFFCIYIAATALSLPVGLILSLVSGALFGRWVGAGVVSLASTGGACLAFLGSRYLFRDWVRRHFGVRLQGIDRGVERDGAWYLLTLRLMPYVPFFLINLGMALTPLRLSTFALVSWLGMLPGTLVIVNAGTALGQLEKPSDALSPTFVGSLALLGLVPLLIRWTLRWLGRSAPPS
jgi:uncharacterized membrane protein YdjX (TVP38/TMEM64 family)